MLKEQFHKAFKSYTQSRHISISRECSYKHETRARTKVLCVNTVRHEKERRL